MQFGHADHAEQGERGGPDDDHGARDLSGAPLRRSTATTGGGPLLELVVGRMPPGRILNIGAGLVRVDVPARRITYVDADHGVLGGAHECAAADAATLPFHDQVFHGAVLKDVLEHVADPIAVLREIRRVCTPQAPILVTVPRAIPRAVWADPTHIRGFTRRAIATAFELGGWDVVGRIDRIGSIPGAGRWPWLLRNAHRVLRIPGVGHRLGTNWLVAGRRSDD